MKKRVHLPEISMMKALKPLKSEYFCRRRESSNLTQEELAEKVGSTKNYISRIENDASDIKLSTLLRIIREGLGGQLKLTFDA